MTEQDPPVPATPLSLPQTDYSGTGVHIPRAIAHSNVAITRHRRLQKTKLCRYGEHCTYRPLGRCFYAHTEEELKERPPKTEEEILAEQMEAAHTIAMQDQADMWGMWPSHPAPAPALVAAPYGVPLALSHYSGLHTACWTFAMQAAAVAEAARLSANEPAQPYYAEGLYGMDYYSWTALKDAQRAMHAPSGGARHEIPTASASATASVGADPLSSGGGGTPNASSVDDFGKHGLERTQSDCGEIGKRRMSGFPMIERAVSR